jgi:hypothetical protein
MENRNFDRDDEQAQETWDERRTGLKLFHPLADIFPMLEGKDFADLVTDIKANGLHKKITLHPDGKILDGRNRYRACLKAGVEPRFWTYNGNDPAGYVVSMNIKRRMLDKGQRAMIAEKIETTGWGGFRRGDQERNSDLERTRTEAATLMRVSKDSVGQAKLVREKALPVFTEAVERGRLSLNFVADKIATKPPVEQRAEAQRLKWALEGGRANPSDDPPRWRKTGKRSINPARLTYADIKAWFHDVASEEDKVRLATDDVFPFMDDYERRMGA